jgi:phosphohistidine swiveling domain-containing protein
MTTAAFPSEAARVRGSWERDPSHFPLPLSPAFASLYLPWQSAALAAMFAAFGHLAGGVRTRLVDGYLYLQVVPVGGWTPPPWLARALMRLWWLHPTMRRRVRRAERRLREGYPEHVLARWAEVWRPRVAAELRAALAVDLPSLSDAALLRYFDTLRARGRRYVRIHFLLHGAIAPAMARLEFLCRTAPELAGIAAADLVAGLSGPSSEPGRALGALAGMLRARPELLAEARRRGPEAFAACVDALDPAFGARFRAWLDAYGHRITARYEFMEPTLAEQPGRVMALILAQAERPAGEDPEQATARRREEAVAAARARLTDPRRREAFDAALAAAQRAYPVRDDNVLLTFNAFFALVRYALREAGRRWQGRYLERRDDVFFLTADEVRDGLARGAAAFADGLGLHAAARRRTWERRRAAPPPPLYLGRPPVIPPLDALPPDAAFMNRAIVWYLRGIQSLPIPGIAPDGPPAGDRPQAGATAHTPAPGGTRVRGLAAVGGRYRGVARVVRGEEDFARIEPGDVLVCPMTSPAWAVLFPQVGALVTDHGGVLSHPAVIAREFGIPAVVATHDGTRRIPDGATVLVDGTTGVVTVEGREEALPIASCAGRARRADRRR